jgi:phosphonate C-P lyase system protein PhnH
MARPGKINHLDQVELNPPAELNKASALAAFALMNGDVSFHAVNMGDDLTAYLKANTRAAASSIEDAAFVFVDGNEEPDALEGIHCGVLTYPETAATLVIQVDAVSDTPLPGGLKLQLEGPGVGSTSPVYVRRLNPELLLALQARNMEFPLGIDTLLTCDNGACGDPCVLGIPRTTKVTWEACN